jgi:hypothetical protein
MAGIQVELQHQFWMTAITLLAIDFVKIQFDHNYREANQVAHELARVAYRHDQSFFF